MNKIPHITEYFFETIVEKLPPLKTNDEEMASKLVSSKRIDLTTARIALRLLLYFNDNNRQNIDQVFVHRGKTLNYSLYIIPKHNVVHFVSGQQLEKFQGGNKSGHRITYIENGEVKQAVKLSNKFLGVKYGKELNNPYVHYVNIPQHEIEAFIHYTGKPGFVTVHGIYNRTKEKVFFINSQIPAFLGNYLQVKASYPKTTLLLESFSHNLRNCLDCSPQEIHLIFQHIAMALQQLHTDGVIHGDIDSDNILVARDKKNIVCKAALTDFGFIKKADCPAPCVEKYLEQPELVHNARPCNYSPESVRHLYEKDLNWTKNDTKYSRKANDMYAFGIAMFTLLNSYEPSWCQKISDLVNENFVNSSTSLWQQIITFQSNIKKNIEIQSKKNETLRDQLLLITYKMLHPDLNSRLTIDQVVDALTKL